ncbi:ferritin-like domain-containing protein [Aquimarina sp. 2201CG1-2-11]|uniref:Dps family protein n=1 Tax=Aquimarina discodermiae TaxID=3231043 RepID=UPI003463241D
MKAITKPNPEIIETLNTVILDYHLYYQKLRTFHWSISGPYYFESHVKFEVLYEAAKQKMDEIAESILTINGTSANNETSNWSILNFKKKETDLTDDKIVSIIHELISTLLEDNETLLKELNVMTQKASDVNDKVTLDIIGSYLEELEKTSWMHNAWNQRK